jgi:H-NS histone family
MATITKNSEIMDWQGHAWKAIDAFSTVHGFAMYKGYAVKAHYRYSSFILTPELAQYLRKTRYSDVVLPISCATVHEFRKQLGVSKVRAPINRTFEWTESKIALLGTIRDVDAAKALGVRLGMVRGKRRELDIKVFVTPIFWTEERKAMLGTMPDVELAQLLGATKRAVTSQRMLLKLPTFGNWSRKGTKPVRYRDPVSQATWNGRGNSPQWIKGKMRADFLIR